MFFFKPTKGYGIIGGSEVNWRRVQRYRACKGQRWHAIHRDKTLKRHVSTSPLVIRRCVIGIHAMLWHGLSHFGAIHHFSDLVLRNSRLGRNLHKQA